MAEAVNLAHSTLPPDEGTCIRAGWGYSPCVHIKSEGFLTSGYHAITLCLSPLHCSGQSDMCGCYTKPRGCRAGAARTERLKTQFTASWPSSGSAGGHRSQWSCLVGENSLFLLLAGGFCTWSLSSCWEPFAPASPFATTS